MTVVRPAEIRVGLHAIASLTPAELSRFRLGDMNPAARGSEHYGEAAVPAAWFAKVLTQAEDDLKGSVRTTR